MSAPPPLSPVEARVLGVLLEKARTTPDVYPLTVNALTAGCNQKTSREPVMTLAEAEVQAALDALRSRVLVLETFGASGRVLRYAHNFPKVYGVPAAAADLLAVLMLRGPQTASELRANAERLHHFADASAVEGYLYELAERPEGPLAVLLPRQPGSRESRWAHLLCGPAVLPPPAAAGPAVAQPEGADLAALLERMDRLEAEVRELRGRLDGS
ncbi:MAG: YceH family protein [Pseudomonadota bacterium]